MGFKAIISTSFKRQNVFDSSVTTTLFISKFYSTNVAQRSPIHAYKNSSYVCFPASSLTIRKTSSHSLIENRLNKRFCRISVHKFVCTRFVKCVIESMKQNIKNESSPKQHIQQNPAYKNLPFSKSAGVLIACVQTIQGGIVCTQARVLTQLKLTQLQPARF